MWKVYKNMRLYINYKIKESGKGKFLKMLIPRLEDMGVKCSFKKSKQDIALGIRYWRGEINMPCVLRVDGVYIWKNKKTFWRNNLTKKAIKQSDAVIWQSNFCKYMASGLLKVKAKRDFVIFNGADPKNYCCPLKNTEHKYTVIMSARWKNRPWKRLKDCIKVAEEVRGRNIDAVFLIAGKVNEKIKKDGIYTLGHLPDDRLKCLLAGSDAMLNLSYNDWCPNAVVEALCAGLPVVGNNCSGIREIVGDNSRIVDVDPSPQAKYLKVDKPPKINVNKVADALVDVLHNSEKKVIDKVNIDVIARQYKNVFEEVLNAR